MCSVHLALFSFMFMISFTCGQKTPIRNISYLVGEKQREWSPSSVWDIASVLLVITLAVSNLQSKLSSSDAWVGYMPPVGKSKSKGLQTLNAAVIPHVENPSLTSHDGLQSEFRHVENTV